MPTTLDQLQHLIDELTPLEQVRLLEYLTPRIARAVATMQRTEASSQPSLPEPWQTFFQLGDRLVATDSPADETLTQTILAMRR